MKVEIITPKGIELEQEATQIVLPTQTGEITVLPHHVPLISVLKAGRIKITGEKGETEKEIEGGILEIADNKAVILLKKF
jgi:F-type H+-transporting ATPase subunit epsilon